MKKINCLFLLCVIICLQIFSIKTGATSTFDYNFSSNYKGLISASNNKNTVVVTNGDALKLVKSNVNSVKSLDYFEDIASVSVVENEMFICENRRMKTENYFVNQIIFTIYNLNNNKSNVFYINGYYAFNSYNVAYDGKNIYVINDKNNREVIVFNKNGEIEYSVDMLGMIEYMCYEPSDNKIYVYIDKQLFTINRDTQNKDEVSINGDKEDIRPIGNGSFINGNAEVFYENGAKRFNVNTRVENAVVVEDIFYVSNKNVISGYSQIGKKIKEITLNEQIVDMLNVGSDLGVVTENEDINFYSEVEIPDFIEPTEKTTENEMTPQGVNSIESNVYSIDYENKYVDLIAGTTIAQFKLNVKSSYNFSFVNYKNIQKTSGVIGTNSKVRLVDKKGIIKDSYIIIVNGDVTGEGNINSRDVKAVAMMIASNKELEEPYTLACNKQNGKIDAVSLVKIINLTE